MSIYNEILSARYARMLQKLFSMKGPPPVRQLAGEVMTILQLFNGVENRYLEGWERFGFQAAQAGAAAVFSNFRFRNPVNSGIIAVFEKLQAAVGPTDALVQDQTLVQMGATGVDLVTTYATQQQLDSRSRPNSALAISSQTNAGALGHNIGIIFDTSQGGDFILFEEQELSVLPGQGLQLSTQVVNQALVVGAIWRERPLEDSEKA